MAKEKDGEGGKSKSKLILIVVALLIALGGGGAGGYFLFAPKSSEKAAPKPGLVVPLDPITINLAEGHYLKLGFALQATEDVAEAPSGAKAFDIAIDLFSNRSVAELSSNDERKKMKKELKEKISKAYDEEIMDVYLTEFVMQ